MASNEQRLQTPRAAGVVGIAFALLTTAAIVLVRVALPEGAEADTSRDPSQQEALRTALGLVPFAGIFFLWFMGALRSQAGEREDRFIATVFLGSGLLFVATLFGAAAAAGSVLDTAGAGTGQPPGGFGEHFAYTLMTTYSMRMAAVFAFTTSAIGHRLGFFPRPLTVLGYLVGLTLLFLGPSIPWSELVFPCWSLIVSVHILRAGFRSRPSPLGVT
ncbi:hypothetical protein NLX86_15480 [Streptomyces sp. A3M-1-3]|uniref:hypothetical protein n=1 Tax=Streptomyces sp. A3M-1-3 TaxID=2962044 RepID=UPI0020B65564|nr:hypothetical protein [Streptomyces sp. A3M-1-3]MCP3819456.1 hypothetical protein [Streptomyces sp. A3M-1-3]